jgi:hypothetical protein
LQQLKAYKPPKLDYLSQLKGIGDIANRMSLISADASNHNYNPRFLKKMNDSSINTVNRKDPTRDSLQSRLIERIHNKKIQNN